MLQFMAAAAAQPLLHNLPDHPGATSERSAAFPLEAGTTRSPPAKRSYPEPPPIDCESASAASSPARSRCSLRIRLAALCQPAPRHPNHQQPFPVYAATNTDFVKIEPAPERGMKRSRSFQNHRTPDTILTPYLGPIDHNLEPIRSSASSSPTASRFDVSHGGWSGVASNATTAALDPETVVSLLQDPNFRPGPRPSTFAREMGTWIFKEGRDFHLRGKAAAGHHSDRWCVQLDFGCRRPPCRSAAS